MVRSLYDKYQLLNALLLMLRYFTSMCDIRTAHELTIPGNLREVEPLSEGTAFKHRRGDAGSPRGCRGHRGLGLCGRTSFSGRSPPSKERLAQPNDQASH